MLVVVTTVSRARAPLFDRLHARGPAPAALLRLSVAVHLRHADAGDGRQSRAAVLRLGRRRPRLLSADRLLVQKPSANAAAIKAFVVNRVGDFGFALGIFAHLLRLPARSTSTRSSPPRRASPARPFMSSAIDVDALTIDLPAAVHGRDGQVGAVPAAHLAARRDGRPDAGLGADPRRDHGDRRRLHGRAAVAAVRAGAGRARPSSPSSARPPPSSPRPSASCRTTSSA